MSESLWPYGLQPATLLSPWNFSGKNTGVGCRLLFSFSPLPWVFPIQGSNLFLLHCLWSPAWQMRFFTAEPPVLALYINILPIYGYFSQVYFGNFCVISFPRWYGDYICVCTSSVQFTQSCLILCDPMDSCRPSLPVSPINNKGQLFFTFMALLDITNQIASLIK